MSSVEDFKRKNVYFQVFDFIFNVNNQILNFIINKAYRTMLSFDMLEMKFNEQGQRKIRAYQQRNEPIRLYLSLKVGNEGVLESGGKKYESEKFNFIQQKFRHINTELQRIELVFSFRSQRQHIGECYSFLVRGYNRTDVMNLQNRQGRVIGGVLFDALWIEEGPRSFINGRNISELRSSNVHKKKQEEQQEGFFSFLSCFSSSKTKAPKKRSIVPANTLMVYTENELDRQAPKRQIKPLQIQYYSKST